MTFQQWLDLVFMVTAFVMMMPVLLKQHEAYLQANGYKREKRLLFLLGWTVIILIVLRVSDIILIDYSIPNVRNVMVNVLCVLLALLYKKKADH